MRSDFQHVLAQREAGVLTITMNRPAVLNAFNDLMVQELIEIVEVAARDEEIRCVVLTGAGRAFGSGQDLSLFAQERTAESSQVAQEHLHAYHRLVVGLQQLPQPVIAAIHGVATGISLNIALACDLRIAADDARLSEAFARIGLVPDGGGAYFLTRLLGSAKALELALLAEEINGVEAERIGLVNKCVPLSELEETVATLARRLANGPTRTYGLIKQLFHASQDKDLAVVLQLEGEFQSKAINTADHREGVQAFMQKRPPKYIGK
ncbi:enoyl-CoA hydratase/isomerase family protein [Dictyobacter formicarum]|uniref:2-(1,2-epoxy-1,2-dihydrophenyl)acetyl-CoA isomerase n=1 Tax=Dictyobacter formicarum TaxID=2778368 RepID=A0ABQ3VFR9_9CHLR|nr:enoyl-CoA hydratase-related protein [Dictyobacter formicarum]GHO84574.1 2-(1,2-epoxy-1,2-dihydrophenyl)acetyl-CoA isomerase [Dictyobacter formicarum]